MVFWWFHGSPEKRKIRKISNILNKYIKKQVSKKRWKKYEKTFKKWSKKEVKMKKKPSKNRCEKKHEFWMLRAGSPEPPFAPTNTTKVNKIHTNLPHKPNNERRRWVKKGECRKVTSTIWHASGAFRPGADILELRVAGGIRLNAARFAGYWGRAHRILAPGHHFPASDLHFSASDINFLASSVHFPASHLHFPAASLHFPVSVRFLDRFVVVLV